LNQSSPQHTDATKLFLRVKKTDFLRLMKKANENQALNYYFVIVLIILKLFSSNHRIRSCFPIAGVAKKRSLNFSFCTQEVSVFTERRPLHAYNLRIFIESLNVKIRKAARFAFRVRDRRKLLLENKNLKEFNEGNQHYIND